MPMPQQHPQKQRRVVSCTPLSTSTTLKESAATHSAEASRLIPAATTSEDASTLQLRHSLQLQKKRYDELLADSHKLRSEYDAYQLRMEHVARQYKQQALQDKHMLEELRLTGTAGSLDEVYVTGLKRQIGELQKKLTESMAAAEKAYQRQREAEEARMATEKSKREDLAALASQIAHFGRASSTPIAESAGSPDAGEQKEGKEDEESVEIDEKKAAPVENVDVNARLLQAQAQLAVRQAEVDELRTQLQLRDSAHQQQSEEHTQDLQTLRMEVEQFKEHESALKASHMADLKKEAAEFAEKEAALRREVETARAQVQKASMEQSSQRVAKELLETQEREQEERMQAKDRELQSARASLQSVQAAMEAAHGELREMEMTLHDAQTENRQLQAKVDQTSAELLRSEQLLASREDDLLDAEKERQRLRAMLRREEEETLRVQQQLTQLQRSEAERGLGTAAAAATAAQLFAHNEAAGDGTGGEGEDDAAQLSSVVATQRQTIQSLHSRIEVLENELTAREVALRRQQAQAQEISAARIEFMKAKEEANTRVAQYKDRIERLENDLAAARRSGATAVSVFGMEDGRTTPQAQFLTSSMERHHFLMEAKRSADSYRISRVRQMRLAFFSVLSLVVGMTLYATFALAPPPAEKQ
ncbi:hypothetical protein ABB37_01278 [Leptomonas pyrrhocoris]|uniref:Uncharacterized protein n=1 Tax=Leptomonas pyrrhocoris TaxID=157538 RepID=A0A0M9G8Q2_LEPPY|nr:hypothetical protein ABB37_01278 [Leptomonas pyrrhocoris]KPA84796.1 hypothetical protein ABB37_01278 [Leptomonas pyrrhocoris]|eukprot:XP_015663235.1 hypothetical protein ABB37_01278 [Leptomonas pyrrhocoris]